MPISYEFFKHEETKFYSFEDALIFFVENYSAILKMFRVIQAQLEETKRKKEDAHQQLQKLREKLEKINEDKISLSEEIKEEFEVRKNYYTRIREEDDVVFYNGLPIDLDEAANLILKYQGIFKYLESIDRNGRLKLNQGIKTVSRIGLSPIRRLLTKSIKVTKNKQIRSLLKLSRKIVIDFPENFEDYLLKDLDIDLDKHRPVA